MKVQKVAVKKKSVTGADWEMMSNDQFLKMNNNEQIKLVLDGCVKFYDANGDDVPVTEAIKVIGLM